MGKTHRLSLKQQALDRQLVERRPALAQSVAQGCHFVISESLPRRCGRVGCLRYRSDSSCYELVQRARSIPILVACCSKKGWLSGALAMLLSKIKSCRRTFLQSIPCRAKVSLNKTFVFDPAKQSKKNTYYI